MCKRTNQIRVNSEARNSFRISLFLLLAVSSFNVLSQQTISFPSIDKLPITADLYKINDSSRYIILCHLAEHSRGEYKEIAKRLNNAGYNCLAIDTRTGNEVFGIVNETAKQAILLSKPIGFLNSEQDIIAAIAYAHGISSKGVILLGSSFSASLALKISINNPKVKAVVAFSPGEHFEDELELSFTSNTKVTCQLTWLLNLKH